MLRKDDLQNGYMIYQDPELFCFGVDAVLLAHYPKLKNHDRILDLCTGFAPVPLILRAEADKRKFEVDISGLEIQPYVAETARLSVKENQLEEKVHIVTGDVKEAASLFGAASFSLITCNPPYMAAKDGLIGTSRAKAVARTEILCTLEDVISSASKCLRPQGRLALIHKPFRLPEIFELMRKYHVEPKRMRLICPYPDAEPTMVLVEGLRGGRPYLKVDPPLFIYNEDRTYTRELLNIYGREE